VANGTSTKAVTSSTPIWVSGGQLETAVVHVGTACGLEIRPGGRSTLMLRTPSEPLNVKSVMPTNGCAPARVSTELSAFLTSAVKELTPNVARAGVAAMSRRTAATKSASVRGRMAKTIRRAST
jgi:hypothetical protein